MSTHIIPNISPVDTINLTTSVIVVTYISYVGNYFNVIRTQSPYEHMAHEESLRLSSGQFFSPRSKKEEEEKNRISTFAKPSSSRET
ncbi:hypothetical protein CEXT_12911 [Caerostris extrusa]|uniref:Uncharacterized protein n=1 Tax=Caerostris extrusa TaxID=172846 RepID=A0AAV4XGV3_CAEEX|nr:hypothetical protein CEXT_12911 [Caerostris extrusa]